MSTNRNLQIAAKRKNDEFYTSYKDVEEEVSRYSHLFKGKTIYCNCDNPHWSNFFRFFLDHFVEYGLKRLLCSGYERIDLFNQDAVAYWCDVSDPRTVDIMPLRGDGDFRSEECVKLLDDADIVVTNPPFSLFREYVGQLIKKKKKFLILGNMNAITYKEIFPLIKENKLWLGYKFRGMEFDVPSYYTRRGDSKSFSTDSNGQNHIKLGNTCWFTNLPHKKRNEKMILFKKYNPKDYPKYDNYDAINVDKVSEIPMDYDGVMGVPITFLDKYCPEQFEIVEFRKGKDGKDLVYSTLGGGNPTILQNTYPSMPIGGLMNNPKDTTVNGKSKYARILIRRLQSQE